MTRLPLNIQTTGRSYHQDLKLNSLWFLQEQRPLSKEGTWAIYRNFGHSSLISDTDMAVNLKTDWYQNDPMIKSLIQNKSLNHSKISGFPEYIL